MLSEKAVSIIEKGSALLPTSKGETAFDLEVKASQLLVLWTQLAAVRKDLSNALIAAQSVEKAAYASTFMSGEEKLSDAKRKVLTESAEAYVTAHMAAKDLESDIKYIETIISIIENGHMLYRQMLKATQQTGI